MEGHHRVTIDWMGEQVETLADLLPSRPRAVCVGVNPAPPSVAVGHYFQGRQGQRFFDRLRQAGALPTVNDGFEDDAAFAAGIGFTDLVKRPTARASEVTRAEREHGATILSEKLSHLHVPVLIFPFKDAAAHLVGPFKGNGWLGERFAGAELFVMPGPYESRDSAASTIASLGQRLAP
jgi:TDG/mug DNA glycosylase family protein